MTENPKILGYLINDWGQTYGTIYLKGTGAIIDSSQDVWNQDCEMSEEEFCEYLKRGHARALNA